MKHLLATLILGLSATSVMADDYTRDGVIVDHVQKIRTDKYAPFKACEDFEQPGIAGFGACAGGDKNYPTHERQRPAVTESYGAGMKGALWFRDGIEAWHMQAND